MVVHSPDSGFSSISIASSSKQAINPIGVTHTASELVVQLQQQRLVSHKQPFSSWADGAARRTNIISAHPRKHQPCVNPVQQWAALQPQDKHFSLKTSTGIDSRLHCRWQHQWNTCPQQDRNTGSSSQVHTHFILHFSIYYNAGWVYLGCYPD